jgi:outer membrane protein OmpA-like peptidoglycan-associated protein
MENIMDIMSTVFQGDAVERLSSQIHETRSATKRGLDTAVPASIAGLAAHTSNEQRAEELLQAIRGDDYPHVDATEVTRVVGDPAATTRVARSGEGFLNGIFGNRLSGIVDAIAGQSGVSRASASTLLGLATPLVLGAVGKEAKSRNLDARGLSRFLADQGRRASDVLPGSVSSVLGGGTFAREGVMGEARERFGEARERIGGAVGEARERIGGAVEDIRHHRHMGAERVGRPGVEHRGGRGLMWLLGALFVLALLAFFVLRARRAETPLRGPDVGFQSPDLRPGEPRLPGVAPGAAGIAMVERLSPDTGVTVFEGYLTGTEATPKRFILSEIQFPTASANIPSNALLDGVAASMKKHPTAKIRIEGHTDSTGNPSENQKLSDARANSVKDYLVQRGVAADRIESAGKGSDEPLAPGDSPAARAENRRVELIVLER